MEYRDKVLKCAECGAEFVFTAGEQAFFADKGFKNEPKRCKPCKSKRGQNAGGGGGGGENRGGGGEGRGGRGEGRGGGGGCDGSPSSHCGTS